MTRLSLLLVVSFAAWSAAAADQVFYQNPVIAGDHPDPSIIRDGKDYWATCTSSAWGPLFPLLHSTDLVNWEQTGAVLPHRPDWATGDFWAPEISEFNGKFFVYYVARAANGHLAVAVATADQPGGPYTDRGPIVSQDDGSIDPMPVTDTNGVRYLVWKEDGNSRGQPTPIWAQRLNDDGTKLVDQPHELIHNEAPWEGGVVEGPYVLRRNGWFYLFYAGNACCGADCNYAEGVARARSLLGPYEKDPANPILAGNATWKCPGHGSMVLDPQGRCFFLHHAYSATGTIFTGREALLDEVKFGADEWPTMNDGHGPSTSAPSPFGAVQKAAGGKFSDDFTGANLDSGWEWPQQHEPVYQLQPGKLLLAANGRGTNFLAAVLARPTMTVDYTATTALETADLKPGSAIGLSAFGDPDNALGAVVCDGKVIVLRRSRGKTSELNEQSAPAGSKIFLRLTARFGYRFQFQMSSDGENWTSCGEAFDEKSLPPWDRGVRVALTAGGITGARGTFDSFSITPP